MKVIRFKTRHGEIGTGFLEGGVIREIEIDASGKHHPLPKTHRDTEAKILSPCTPTKIVGIGLNYRDHAEEMKKRPPDEPLIFLKPPSSVIAHGEQILYPAHFSSRIDYEGELAVVIGKEARWVKEESWRQYVLGFTCINDVTARDLQARDIQYTRAKGFDTFSPLGPVIETELDPYDLEITTRLNGEIKQHSRTSELIFPIPRLLSFITRIMTLLPGDVIATGTPSGVGPMRIGDTIEVEIEGIGVLSNTVAKPPYDATTQA